MSKPTPHQSSELLEKNKQLVQNFIEDTLNSHDVSTADKYFGQDPRTEGFKEYRRRFFEQFQIHIQQ
jgi:predicted SnoaL-like aldol condensation-catalyzing enzyme